MRTPRFAFAVFLFLACGSASRDEPLGVVSAATPEAAEAGARILRAGGNAVDAAVAVAFALSVTEPAMSGLGGQTQILLLRPGDAGAIAINGSSFAPAATPRGVDRDDLTGHRATTVPTTVASLGYVLREHGSGRMSWPDVIAPAIEYAEDGFSIGPFRSKVLRRHADDLAASPSAASFLSSGDGLWKQPVLAKTLRRLAEAGANDFYRGEIARQIVDDMKAHGGWVSRSDLELVKSPRVEPALRGSYRGDDVWTFPPPGGGPTVLRILAELEASPREALVPSSPSRGTLVARALRRGHAAREDQEGIGETTHFSVVDRSGLAVSVTASINNYFGARVASPALGFLYNDYMREFRLDETDHPFALAPNRAPYSSMSPTIVARDGRVRLVLGSPGSARIISAVAQVIQLVVDAGMPIAEAVAHPRIHALGDGRLFVETGASVDDLEGFRREEPTVDLAQGPLNPYFGGVHAIAFEDDAWRGAADPRRDVVALMVRP